jgi:hypothetical protein
MFTLKIAVRTALAALPLILLPLPPINGAEASSDSERLEKLERAVQQLQQRNSELEVQVKFLKQTSAFAPIPAEGPTKKQVVSDGKTYVEKSVPVEKSAADKWKLSTPITELELYGDIRFRYDYRGGQTTDHFTALSDDWQERERWRYRFRLGLRGTLMDDWFFGVRLETSTSPRSTNVTFGDDSGVNGPFSKDSDRISVGQAYIGYKGFPDIVLMGGRMPLNQVLVTTRMVWDDDINPEGASEQWKHSFSFGSTEEAPDSYGKDSKNVVAPAKSEPFLKLDLFANFGQFIYDDVQPTNPLGPRPTVSSANGGATDQTGQRIPNAEAVLLAWQVGAKLNFPKTFYAQLAPTMYNYTGNGDTFNIHFQGGDPFISNTASLAQNQTGINSLLIYDMPWEIGWKIDKLPMRVFGDFAVNFDGDDRAAAAGHPGHGDQRYAYQVGAGVGQLKKKHDWLVEALWQHTDQYSLDPNLVDSDLFDFRVNLQGPIVRAGYMLSDAVWFNVTWGYAWRSDDSLGTGGLGDIAINPLDHYQIFQADFNLKF